MDKTKVSASNAAKMVGVSRATFYRHIEEKSISTEEDKKGNKVVDVAELIRVYGDNLKTLEEVEKAKRKKKKNNETSQDNKSNAAELALLKEKVRILETERERERGQLAEQIEDLKGRLEGTEKQRIKAEDQKDRLTLMLTDQRSEKEKNKEAEKERIQRFEKFEETIKGLKLEQKKILTEKSDKRGIWGRLFGT